MFWRFLLRWGLGFDYGDMALLLSSGGAWVSTMATWRSFSTSCATHFLRWGLGFDYGDMALLLDVPDSDVDDDPMGGGSFWAKAKMKNSVKNAAMKNAKKTGGESAGGAAASSSAKVPFGSAGSSAAAASSADVDNPRKNLKFIAQEANAKSMNDGGLGNIIFIRRVALKQPEYFGGWGYGRGLVQRVLESFGSGNERVLIEPLCEQWDLWVDKKPTRRCGV